MREMNSPKKRRRRTKRSRLRKNLKRAKSERLATILYNILYLNKKMILMIFIIT